MSPFTRIHLSRKSLGHYTDALKNGGQLQTETSRQRRRPGRPRDTDLAHIQLNRHRLGNFQLPLLGNFFESALTMTKLYEDTSLIITTNRQHVVKIEASMKVVEARQQLWVSGSYTLSTDQEAARFSLSVERTHWVL